MNKTVSIGNLISEGLGAGRNGVAAIAIQMKDGSARSSRSVFRIEIEISLFRDRAGAAEQYRIEHGYLIRFNECVQFNRSESTRLGFYSVFARGDVGSKELPFEIGAGALDYFVGSGFPNAHAGHDLDCRSS